METSVVLHKIKQFYNFLPVGERVPGDAWPLPGETSDASRGGRSAETSNAEKCPVHDGTQDNDVIRPDQSTHDQR